MTIPADYRVQNGCHNCAHGVRIFDYDGEQGHYCAFNAPPRPPCGSVAMGEYRPYTSDADDEAWYKAWEAWADKRVVMLWGMCSQWATASEPALEPPPSATEAMAELREKFGHYFDAIEDVDEWVRQQRSGEDDPPTTQQEAQP